MRVIETIDRLADLALSKPFRRKAETYFVLASRIAPFYKQYALARGAKLTPAYVRDHILFLWSQYCVGSEVSADNALRLELHMPDVDGIEAPTGHLATYAESAVICALHLTWYSSGATTRMSRMCRQLFRPHRLPRSRERVGSNSGVPVLSDLLVVRSRLFREETDDFEAALLKDEGEEIVSRPLLIANMDRDLSAVL